jgi:hypothetical protein
LGGGTGGNGCAGDNLSLDTLFIAASAAAVSAGPFLRGIIGAAGAALGDRDELLLFFLVKNLLNLLKKPGFDVRGSAALLSAFKRFASALSRSHVLNFLVPCLAAFPILLGILVRAYSGGAASLSSLRSLSFLSDFDKVSSLVGLVSSNLLAVSCKFIEVLDLCGDDGDDDGNDENDETDCVGDVFDVFDDCEKFDE